MQWAADRLRGMWPYALLVGLCLMLYLPGIAAIPPLDRDEARFAQATRQMLDTGDFLRIRFQDEERNRKPAGIYWLQAAAVGAFSSAASTAIWPYRLPSLVGAILAVLLTAAFAASLFGGETGARHRGMIAAVLLASAAGVVAEAHLAKTDAALLTAITASQGALGLAYVRARAGRRADIWIAVVFWGSEIAAVLLKGPPGPLLAIVTAATLSIADRDMRWLRGLHPVIGTITLVATVAPWLVAIEGATKGRFLADSLGHDLLMKLKGGQELHGAPPLSYLLLALVTFWPGSLLIVPALIKGWRRRRAPARRFLLAWLVPAWVLLELVPTKLPHYVLPLYPALAMLAAAALVDDAARPAGAWARRLDLLVGAIWVAVTIGLAALLIGLPLRFGNAVASGGVAGAIVLLGLLATLLRHRHNANGAVALIPALSLALAVPAGLSVLPGLDRLWLSRAAAELVARHPDTAGRKLVAVGYGEPSLVFLLGTNIRLATPDRTPEILRDGGEALVSSGDDPAFRRVLSAHGLAAQPLGRVSGLDYSNGQNLVLTLYAVTPG